MEKTIKQTLKCPIAIEWSITENRLKDLGDDPFLTSEHIEVTHIPGVHYSVYIYPQVDLLYLPNKQETRIYFNLQFKENIKIQANYKIIIPSANYSEAVDVVFEKPDGYGVTCCETKEFFDPEKKFIVDGKLVIKIEGTLMIEQDVVIKKEPLGDHTDALCLGLWKQDIYKDFTIVCNEKEIQAHKNVLAARSPVFTKMFESGMKEAQEGKVTIEDFPFEIVEMAVKYCYHHSLVNYTTLEKKIKLLQFFDKYDIQPLKDDLEKYLITVINELTVCGIVNGALISNALKLEEKCSEFLQKCLHERKPVNDLDLLDKDFVMNIFKSAFFYISK